MTRWSEVDLKKAIEIQECVRISLKYETMILLKFIDFRQAYDTTKHVDITHLPT